MKYPITTANGDAGEFFFAYQIANTLKWPCRLFDIDIGLDAQVEIINTDRSSTGRFVAFQIKAISKEESNCRYVSKKQLDYWRDLDLPVFVVLVDLSIGAMFLHRVDANKKYPETKTGNVRIDFNLINDRFSASSAEGISAAADESALSHVKKRLSVVEDRVNHIRELIFSQEINPGPQALIEFMTERSTFREELAQASVLSETLRAGAKEYAKVKSDLEDAFQELRDFMEEWGMHRDWDDHGNIIQFINEGR